MSNKINCITMTILTFSPIGLSNDQGMGNFTPLKKHFSGDGVHAFTSVGTFTYELRKSLFNKGWNPSGIVINKSNLYSNPEDIESIEDMENDLFGFLIPGKQISKTSPLRVIPFRSVHEFKNETQLITNRGFLSQENNRKFYTEEKKDLVEFEGDIPKTQALANEEVFGDYYTYTVTVELNRLGVTEIKDGKYLEPKDRVYKNKELRLKMVKDLFDALCEFTRDIKHQKVLLKPLAVFGGAYESVVPYFWDDILFNKDNQLIIDGIIETIESYDLKDNTIAVVSKKINMESENDCIELGMPVKKLKEFIERIDINENNEWII
ncbi:MAG: hypothetical protein PWP28_2524 [Oceanotoga sp.]|uniref:CRISPR-associated protein Cas7/Cst2/DevR subtype I-B n=1 Tax=Oceanotoga teriensis TaxID=515440 RepID=A0AA45C710_9BACT|nr:MULTISPECIES: type I-B CRISPR-associated protein Cas7/Cst2/DevR [Oceanotoga]MDN5343644.1 hypothetical protein [Oceanotoga sp.]PWJ93309.1 CRISPR-associated protein Cas7/Cst2/DevR subtype I-B [Oceanotoga teriensis]